MNAVRGALVLATKLLVLVLFVGPVLLLVSGSFRDNQEMYRYAGDLSLWTVLPRAPTLDGYARALALPLFPRQLVNTVFLSS